MDFPTSDADLRPFINRDIRLISKKSVTFQFVALCSGVAVCRPVLLIFNLNEYTQCKVTVHYKITVISSHCEVSV